MSDARPLPVPAVSSSSTSSSSTSAAAGGGSREADQEPEKEGEGEGWDFPTPELRPAGPARGSQTGTGQDNRAAGPDDVPDIPAGSAANDVDVDVPDLPAEREGEGSVEVEGPPTEGPALPSALADGKALAEVAGQGPGSESENEGKVGVPSGTS